MKNLNSLLSLFAIPAILMVSSCESTKLASKNAPAAAEGTKDFATREDLTFPIGDDVSARFTGTVYFKNLIQKESTYNFPISNCITFAPGSRSAWHVHGGMEILVVGGKGYYQEEGKKAQIIRKGDVIHIPAGVRHWHGSTADSWFQQIVIYDADWQNPDSNPKPSESISDEYYSNLSSPENSENYAGRKITNSDNFMFGNGTILKAENFSGPVYLSNTLDYPNEAGAPGLHNVVFAKGTYNNWHSHAGGQVLIVTDGIGYHQIQGGELEVLHPGDIALCPPDVMHWHGATANSTFAHVAANANPARPGVVWTSERLPLSEYKNLPQN